MKTVKVPLPEKLGKEVENYVKSGWFANGTWSAQDKRR